MGFGPESCIMMSHLKCYVNIFARSPWGICKTQTHYNLEFSILHLVQGSLRKLAGGFKGSFYHLTGDKWHQSRVSDPIMQL